MKHKKDSKRNKDHADSDLDEDLDSISELLPTNIFRRETDNEDEDKKIEESDNEESEKEEEKDRDDEEDEEEEEEEEEEENIEKIKPETKEQKKLFEMTEKWLWYPETKHGTEVIKCKACYDKFFLTPSQAIDHLKSKHHKVKAKLYLAKENRDKIDIIPEYKEKIDKKKAKNIEKKKRWLEKKQKDKVKKLTPEEIQKKKEKFQEKKKRREERKKAKAAEQAKSE